MIDSADYEKELEEAQKLVDATMEVSDVYIQQIKALIPNSQERWLICIMAVIEILINRATSIEDLQEGLEYLLVAITQLTRTTWEGKNEIPDKTQRVQKNKKSIN